MKHSEFTEKWSGKTLKDILFLYSGDDTVTGAYELIFDPEFIEDLSSANNDLFKNGLNAKD